MRPEHLQTKLAGRVWLAVAVAAISVLWLGALPRLAATARMQDTIERNESLGIDPSAKFYTELPLMPATIDRVDSVRRRDPPAFW